jgi:hypothetical protein
VVNHQWGDGLKGLSREMGGSVGRWLAKKGDRCMATNGDGWLSREMGG